ncbi:MAG: hypothetical protein IPN94_18065 [Sphingobacteriales bacterium]|nr:hypothetical protein [Sphingobacteriales bacterium]
MAAGSYNLKAIAINNNLQEGTSNTTTITVTPTTPPTASLTSPSNNSTFIAPANINLTATATPSSGTTTTRRFCQRNHVLAKTNYPTSLSANGQQVAQPKSYCINNNLQEGTSNTTTITS